MQMATAEEKNREQQILAAKKKVSCYGVWPKVPQSAGD
jgi:hypothetical protein